MKKLTAKELGKKFDNNEMDYQDIYTLIDKQNDELENGNELIVTVSTSELATSYLEKFTTLDYLEYSLYDELIGTDMYTRDVVWDMAFYALDSVLDNILDNVLQNTSDDLGSFDFDNYMSEAQEYVSVTYVIQDDLNYYNK